MRKKTFFAKNMVLLPCLFLFLICFFAGCRSAESSVIDEPPDMIPPPEPPPVTAERNEVEVPHDDFSGGLPEIILPPEPQEGIAYQPVLPDPPPFEFPLPEDTLAFAEPESDAGQTMEYEDTPSEPPAISETEPQEIDVTTESPVPPMQTEEVPRRETPPPPPPFIRLPEQEIVAAPPGEEPSVPEYNLPDPPVVHPNLEEEKIVFSRIIRALAGQLIEIPFRGTGWVYLGELGSRRGVSYESRRLDPEGQTFIFRAEIPETYILKFDKRDFIRDYVLNDYVQVIVGEAAGISDSTQGLFGPPVDRGRVTAEPRWPLTDGPGALAPSQTGGEVLSSAVQPDESPQARDAPAFSEEGAAALSAVQSGTAVTEDYLRRAKEEFDAGRIASALSAFDEMKQMDLDMDDEALWLYAQLLEANSPGRDIRLALDCYRRLIQEFPQSLRVGEAQQRIAYLERYYFNIR